MLLQTLKRRFAFLIPSEIFFVLLYSLEEQFIFIHGSAEELIKGEAFIKHLNFLDLCRGLHTHDGEYLTMLASIPR